MVTDRSEPLRIQRQKILQPQNGVSEKKTHETESEHRERVLLPILFPSWVHTQKEIEKSLQGSHYGGQKSCALGVQDLDEIQAHRLGQRN